MRLNYRSLDLLPELMADENGFDLNRDTKHTFGWKCNTSNVLLIYNGDDFVCYVLLLESIYIYIGLPLEAVTSSPPITSTSA